MRTFLNAIPLYSGTGQTKRWRVADDRVFPALHKNRVAYIQLDSAGGHTDTRSGSLRGWFIHLQRAHSHAQQTAVYLADMLVLAKFMHSRQHHHVYKEQTCGSFKNNRKFKTLISPKQIWELIKRSTKSHFQSQFARIRLHQVIGLCEQTHRSRMHWKATTALCAKTEKKIQILGCLWCEYGITDLQCV